MVKYFAREDGRLRALDGAENATWVSILPPFTQEELEDVAQQFDIPLDYITDSLDVEERSRYEREEDARFVLVSTPILNEVEDESDAIYITVPIGIILIPGTVITVASYEAHVLRLFMDDRVKNFDPADEALFVLQIFEQNVYRFLTCLKQLNLKRDLVEEELFNSSRNRELRQLLGIKKSLVYFVNALSANELLKMKMKRSDFLQIRDNEDKSDLFEDIIIDNSQALEMANVYTHILNGTMEAYGSVISNNLNITIRRLTTITIILMVPTLITSFYGMNVDLPFDQDSYAVYYIVAIAVLLSILLGWYFQRKKLF